MSSKTSPFTIAIIVFVSLLAALFTVAAAKRVLWPAKPAAAIVPAPLDGKAGLRTKYLDYMTGSTRQDAAITRTIYSSEGYDNRTLVLTADNVSGPDCRGLYESEYIKMARDVGFDRFVCRNRSSGMSWDYAIAR